MKSKPTKEDKNTKDRITKIKLMAAATAAAILLTAACSNTLTLQNQGTQTWVSESDTATTIHYTLSDNSLSFVKLTLNNTTYTLPQVVSADGARYTRDQDIVWWEVGDSAFVQTRGDDGEWGTSWCVWGCKVSLNLLSERT